MHSSLASRTSRFGVSGKLCPLPKLGCCWVAPSSWVSAASGSGIGRALFLFVGGGQAGVCARAGQAWWWPWSCLIKGRRMWRAAGSIAISAAGTSLLLPADHWHWAWCSAHSLRPSMGYGYRVPPFGALDLDSVSIR